MLTRNGCRVLVLDDDEDTGEMLQHMIVSAFPCLTVDRLTSSREALTKVSSYHVLVTDMCLGTMAPTGLDVARAFKEARPNGFVVLFSGYSDVSSPYVDLQLGKPVRHELLLSTVEQACQATA